MRHWTLSVCVLILTMAAAAWGQDPGHPDTMYIGSVSTTAGHKAVVSVNIYNDEELAALTVPLHWDSPAITLDSVSFAGSRIAYIASKPVSIYNGTQGVVFGCIVFVEANIPSGNGLAATLYFNIPTGTPDQFVHIDTTTIDPANPLFTNPDASSFVPIIQPGKITIGNPIPPGHIVMNPVSYSFQGIFGYPSPPGQNLNISDGYGGTFSWTATWKSSWLLVAPPTGSAPSITLVKVLTTGLPIGIYYDTIVVTSPTADNSPQYLPIVLQVIAPPPIIVLSPKLFSVSAIQNGVNPADRVLHITDTMPGSQLNWTATHNSTWLTLSPTSGTAPDSITLSFNIVGLSYGNYYDTIVVSDPYAVNSPQRVPVSLQVVSALPVLALDPPSLYVLVPIGTNVDDKIVRIYNSGQGAMTYSATEGSNRITGLTPSSGSAPVDMAISFKTYVLPTGDYYDTVVVTSPEALNSPQRLPIQIHVTNNPANLAVTPSALSFSYFECWQGVDSLPSMKYLQIQNTGSGRLHWSLTHKASWLVVSADSGLSDASVGVSLDATGLTLGTYYDTITVISNDALSGFRQVQVTLNIIPGSLTPLMVYDSIKTNLPAQEVFGPYEFILGQIGNLYNANPGCMDYHIRSDIPWLKFLDTLGQAPANPPASIVIGQYKYGIYPDSFYIYSNSASNSPIKVRVSLLVWKYHGDNNWDDRINVADIVYLINTIFKFGPRAQPEPMVADCNCDGFYNVADAVYLLNYIFKHGTAPCGNP
jgi:hypothetical protein